MAKCLLSMETHQPTVRLLGDILPEAAVKNNWAGIIVNGCIRDSDVIAEIDLGVFALSTIPLKSVKRYW